MMYVTEEEEASDELTMDEVRKLVDEGIIECASPLARAYLPRLIAKWCGGGTQGGDTMLDRRNGRVDGLRGLQSFIHLAMSALACGIRNVSVVSHASSQVSPCGQLRAHGHGCGCGCFGL